MKNSYSIGEFSQVTGLSPKTLRFYHEKGILVPSSIDQSTGYRFYDASKIDKARVIMRLRAMEFSIEDIASVIGQAEDEADILNYLERQKVLLQRRIADERDIVRSLTDIISKEKAAREMLKTAGFTIEEKTVPPLLVAGMRIKGKYSDCGASFSHLARTIGRYISGKPLCLYYDDEYRDEDADFEPCFPVRKEVSAPGVSIKTLPGGRCLSLVHRGPYEQLGRSYARIVADAKNRAVTIVRPTREVYLKGPGLIFKGNPKNYLTEIVLPISG